MYRDQFGEFVCGYWISWEAMPSNSVTRKLTSLYHYNYNHRDHSPCLHLNPHPRCNVLNASQSTYCLFWNLWLWQFSFDGHVWGLHSNWSMRFRQLQSAPQEFSLSAVQSQTGSSEGSIRMRTAVVHLFTWQENENCHNCREIATKKPMCKV